MCRDRRQERKQGVGEMCGCYLPPVMLVGCFRQQLCDNQYHISDKSQSPLPVLDKAFHCVPLPRNGKYRSILINPLSELQLLLPCNPFFPLLHSLSLFVVTFLVSNFRSLVHFFGCSLSYSLCVSFHVKQIGRQYRLYYSTGYISSFYLSLLLFIAATYRCTPH